MSDFPPKPVITENVLPDNLCRSLIEEFQHKPEVNRTNRHHGPSTGLLPTYAPGAMTGGEVPKSRGMRLPPLTLVHVGPPRETFRHSSYVLVNDIVGRAKERVLKAVQDNGMPFSPKAACMFYRWSVLSYYPTHTDTGFIRTASIYLNENYSTVDGGMFLYMDYERNEWIGIEPSFNRSVYFDQTNHTGGTLHMVTPVTSEKERMSIQIFEEN